MNKPIIIAIIGESGSGKTTMAEYLEKEYQINLIQSYTERSKRYPTENGHTFISRKEFDKLETEDMIAYTEWEGNRYCCLHEDVKEINSYVIDESGLKMLTNRYSDSYNVVSIRIHRRRWQRVKSVGEERVQRDNEKFQSPDPIFDCIICNNRDLNEFYDSIDAIIKHIQENKI